jgi:predicted phosphoribosyltransferase
MAPSVARVAAGRQRTPGRTAAALIGRQANRILIRRGVVMSLYENRRQAGEVLACALDGYRGRPDVAVLALPRGGVPVGFEVARRLRAPLDVHVVRKLGVPGAEEAAMGALASGGVVLLDEQLVATLGVSTRALDALVAAERAELARRERVYRQGRPPLAVAGRTVILVDDGMATGASMRAAVASLRRRGPARIVVAVPVAAADTCAALRGEADDVVCVATPEPFFAVGEFYGDFSQTSDEEVRELLAAAPGRAAGTEEGAMARRREVRLALDEGVTLTGDLTIPDGAKGIVADGLTEAAVRARWATLDPGHPAIVDGSCDACPARDGCTFFCPSLGLLLAGDPGAVPAVACRLMRAQVAAVRDFGRRLARQAARRSRGAGMVAASALLLAMAAGAAGCGDRAITGARVRSRAGLVADGRVRLGRHGRILARLRRRSATLDVGRAGTVPRRRHVVAEHRADGGVQALPCRTGRGDGARGAGSAVRSA